MARRYGAYDGCEGVAARALFVIDPHGTIAWSEASPAGINPGADGILEALAAIDARPKEAARD